MKKIFLVIALCLMCAVSFTSCNKQESVDKDFKQVSIACGNGDSILIDRAFIYSGAEDYDYESFYAGVNSNKKIIQEIMQDGFDKLRRECKYPRTFVPTRLHIIRITDTIEYHYINIDENLDDTVTLYITESYVSGYAKNGFGVEDEVSDDIISCYIPDDDWQSCFISENSYYSAAYGKRKKLYKNKKELNKNFETHDLIKLKDGKEYHFDTRPIERYLKYHKH